MKIPFQNGTLHLEILPEREGSETLMEISAAEAVENGESQYQLSEGQSYDYKLPKGNEFRVTSELAPILKPSQFISYRHTGRIETGIYTGRLRLFVLQSSDKTVQSEIEIEIVSSKTTYRTDYRVMLGDIARISTELLMLHSSPVQQNLKQDFTKDAKKNYQRFAFVSSMIETPEFLDAVHKIQTAPATRWRNEERQVDVRRAGRVTQTVMRQFASGRNRVKVPESHTLHKLLQTIPRSVTVREKAETVNTPENQFVKHALTGFANFCSDIEAHLKPNSRSREDARRLSNLLENFLHHSTFKDISTPSILPLNSPILQRKDGYREILKAWLMFDLASKLAWEGGDDVYGAGKRNIANLYEYWVFFELLKLIEEIFDIEPKSIEQLIAPTDKDLGLKLKAGRHIPLCGTYKNGARKLNVKFNYNKAFSKNTQYPKSGSWTTGMRPDYTLSLWPHGFSEEDAEEQEVITHIHFDAKYKVANLKDVFGDEDEDEITKFDSEKDENRKGIYKRADLLKMHAYKDSIRRTAGAYVLYPGDDEGIFKGFHELLPGLGAFPLKPSAENSGAKELKKFISEVVEHLVNRASQKDRMSYYAYDVYKDEGDSIVSEAMPEKYGVSRATPPADVSVIVGYCKSARQYEWIQKNGLYNVRMDSDRGSLVFDKEVAGASYILIHLPGSLETDDIWRITSPGPRVWSKKEMEKKGYPAPSSENYLVYQVQKLDRNEFGGAVWNLRELGKYSTGRGAALPFAVSLVELMGAKIN
jgi:hypothetical protein